MAYLTKRGNVYWARHVWYEQVGKKRKRREKRKSLGTSDEATALRRLDDWRRELEAVRWNENPKIRFLEAAQRWENDHFKQLKAKSAKRYKVSLKHLRAFFGEMFIDEIGSKELSGFVKFRQTHRIGKKKPRPVTPASIKRDLDCLSSFLGYAKGEEWLEVNKVSAFLKARRTTIKNGVARRRYLSHEEETRILAAMVPRRPSKRDDHAYQMHRSAVVFAIETGLRLEEQASLEWHQLQLHGNPHVMVYETKSGIPRRVPLTERALNVVTALPIHSNAKFVFWHGDGERYVNFNDIFNDAAKRAKLNPDVEWHDLRRTCGCRLLQEQGASMVQVQLWLGHSSVTVTERHYAFLKEEALEALVQRPTGEPAAARPSAEIVPMRRKV